LVLALLVGLSPIGSYAQVLLDILQPQQFVVVPVTIDDVKALPSLSHYGDFSQVTHGKPSHASSAQEAAATAGMAVVTPGTLPASVTAPASYVVVPSMSGTFTFSAAKARDTAAAQGKTLPAMPASIDGSSVQLTTGTAVVAVYGGDLDRLDGGAPKGSTPSAGADPLEAGAAAVPQLVVLEAKAPVATSSGAAPKDLEQYLLSQPGISENLANAIRAIGDPTTTWPILVPLGKVSTHSVTVHGTRGTVFTDQSHLATGVIWVKDGMIYAVGAPLNEPDILQVANSLH
jgi:hypothetical protein